MFNQSKTTKVFAGLALALTVLLFAASAALTAGVARASEVADRNVDWGRTGSVTVTPRSVDAGHAAIPGTSYTIYQVASAVKDGAYLRYEVTSDFAGSGADLSDPNASGLAQTLASYAAAQGVAGSTQAAGTDGAVAFTDLPLGLYLLVQTGTSATAYATEPFLVSVPMTNDDGTGWVYDVSASPKAEMRSLVSVSVSKVWNDGGAEASRPASVTVELLRGGETVGTAVLTAADGWAHTWEGLAASDAYSVVEVGVTGYAATYASSGNAAEGYSFTVTNTPKLAQTGQLNWPVPVLAGGGVALFGAGWALVSLRGKRNG